MYRCFMVVIDAHTIMITPLWERTIICLTDLQNLQHTLGKGKLKNSAKAFIQYWPCKFTSQTWHKTILNILPAGNGYQ